MGETSAYQALVSAMSESVALMDREYYSMRLKIEACGCNLDEYPTVLQHVQLTAEDAALYRIKNNGGSGCEVCL